MGSDATAPDRLDAQVEVAFVDAEVVDAPVVDDVRVDVADDGPRPQEPPFTAATADSRLYAVAGAVMVVTTDKIRYGWGDEIGRFLPRGQTAMPRAVQRIDLDEETWQMSFSHYVRCRRRRVGGGPVQCWGRYVQSGDFAEFREADEPIDQPIGDADLLFPTCASRADGVWCWPSVTRLPPSLATTPAPARYHPTPFCAFIGGSTERGYAAQCGYDCANRRIACRYEWTHWDEHGEGTTLEWTPDFAYTLPIDDITAITDSGGGNFVAVRGDGSVWCRGACGGEMYGTYAPPHDDFRPIRGLPPARFAQGSISLSDRNRICVVLRDGTVTCWGICSPALGRHCIRWPNQIQVAENVGGLRNVAEIAMTESVTCAVTTADEVWCWGVNNAHAVHPAMDELEIWEPVRIDLPPRR